MPRTQSLSRFIRSLNFRKNKKSNKSTKSNPSVVPMLIAAVALFGAVAFTVEERQLVAKGGPAKRASEQPSRGKGIQPAVRRG